MLQSALYIMRWSESVFTSSKGQYSSNMGFILWPVDGMSPIQSQLGALHHRSDTPNLSGISIKNTFWNRYQIVRFPFLCCGLTKRLKNIYRVSYFNSYSCIFDHVQLVCVPKSLSFTNKISRFEISFSRSCCYTVLLTDTILHLNLLSLFVCKEPDSGNWLST